MKLYKPDLIRIGDDARPVMTANKDGVWLELQDAVAHMTPGCGDLTLADYFCNDAPGRFAVVRLENETEGSKSPWIRAYDAVLDVEGPEEGAR